MSAPDVVHVDANENGVYELESLCMNCHEDGMTRFLPIKIPYFKDILLESFSCEHCSFRNSTVKNAGQIQEHGTKYSIRVESIQDLQRQVVRSDSGVVRIDDLKLETPPAPGQLTNLEGVFSKIITDLDSDQPARKETNLEMYQVLEIIIRRLKDTLEGKSLPITVSLDDPSGNSFIEPSTDDFKDSKYTRTDYLRSHQENVALGLVVDEDEPDGAGETVGGGMDGVDIVDGEIHELLTECPACSKPCTVNVKKTKIPHFTDVIIMATVCENCGYKTNEVKTGGKVPEHGRRISLLVKRKEDLSRDLLKSETCTVKSQTLGLEVNTGTLGGRFTTIEGLLTSVRDQLHGQIFDTGSDLASGDSMPAETKARWTEFFDKLDSAIKAEIQYDLVFEDPLASSFVQSLDGEDDDQVTNEDYERTHEEMEELGYNDMQTEGYEAEEGARETNGETIGETNGETKPQSNEEKIEEEDLIEL